MGFVTGCRAGLDDKTKLIFSAKKEVYVTRILNSVKVVKVRTLVFIAKKRFAM